MNGIAPLHNIKDNLWLGSFPQGSVPDHIRYIVCCCGNHPWGQSTRGYTLLQGQIAISTEFDDIAKMPPEELIYGIADMVLQLSKQAPTLVHCAAGLNRSGLVLGTALVREGMEPADAIKLMRQKRDPLVLFNNTFRNWLLKQTPQPK